MHEVEAQDKPPEPLLKAIDNLAQFHREHEKFYSQAPLREAVEIQAASRALKSLAWRWSEAEPSRWPAASPFAASYPALADLLGERHRIIANDWQSASILGLIARLLRRGLDLLGKVDFSPGALRADLAGERNGPAYLYSASELFDRAADLLAESATLVHDNERRWRAFGQRIHDLRSDAA